MTIDPRIPTMPGRRTSGFHRPRRHCLPHARMAVRCSARSMKGEAKLFGTAARRGLRTACEADFLAYGRQRRTNGFVFRCGRGAVQQVCRRLKSSNRRQDVIRGDDRCRSRSSSTSCEGCLRREREDTTGSYPSPKARTNKIATLGDYQGQKIAIKNLRGVCVCSFVAWLSHLTIDHASLSRRSTVPTPNRDTSNILELITFFSRVITYEVPGIIL